MIEKTDAAFEQLITKLTELIEKSTEHLPDIAREMLLQDAYAANVWLVVGIGLVVMGVVLWVVAVLSSDGFGFASLGSLFLLFGVCDICINLIDLHKIEHAPKYYLLDKTASYLGK